MNIKRHQTGSAHVVIIALLCVALIGALGVVFYQNFVAKKAAEPSQLPRQATSTPVQTKRIAFDSAIYALDYAEGWKVESNPIPTSIMGGGTTTFTSKDGNVQAKFTVYETAPDITCNEGDGLKIGYYHVDSEPLTKLIGTPLYFVESISDFAGGGYQYKIGLVPDGGDTHATVGETSCNVIHVGNAQMAITGINKLMQPTVQASIAFPKLSSAPKAPASDMQTIKDLMKTTDYGAAVKILESARKE